MIDVSRGRCSLIILIAGVLGVESPFAIIGGG
jgi:hypothetical protein